MSTATRIYTRVTDMSLADMLLRIPATTSTARNRINSTSSRITDVRALRHKVDSSKPKATIAAASSTDSPAMARKLPSMPKFVRIDMTKKITIYTMTKPRNVTNCSRNLAST